MSHGHWHRKELNDLGRCTICDARSVPYHTKLENIGRFTSTTAARLLSLLNSAWVAASKKGFARHTLNRVERAITAEFILAVGRGVCELRAPESEFANWFAHHPNHSCWAFGRIQGPMQGEGGGLTLGAFPFPRGCARVWTDAHTLALLPACDSFSECNSPPAIDHQMMFGQWVGKCRSVVFVTFAFTRQLCHFQLELELLTFYPENTRTSVSRSDNYCKLTRIWHSNQFWAK